MKYLIKNYLGLTLVEVVVAMSIFIVAVSALYFFIVYGYRVQNVSLELAQAATEAQRGINTLVQELRETRAAASGAYPLEKVNSSELVFYADVDNDSQAERLRYYIIGNDFRRGQVEPTGDPAWYDLTTETSRSISTFVQNDDIFVYYNSAWPGDTVNNPLLEPADPTQVKLIAIRLVLNANPLRAPESFTLESTVQLRNLKDNL
jgi:type II secretory pathway component PulJ